ncbi:MAG: multifunctional CCA tRNA nucleotidyl transferase/2'3'-cyclic phosphodiesterase/2'nucleotidase/phosphatase, partial [Burkholderiales bacterium]|nr:multifunctional CCA tRNA nucleotidyl transferase/2'3'-cyclic phosphodiesterase/2'nucleotidase/phosphatase [Burkholderiales bacterium]
LVPERVWQELARGLAEPQPARMFEVLAACGASRRLFPEIDPGPPTLAALARAADARYSVTVRFGVLAWPLGAEGEPALQAACERLRVPNAERDLARLVCRLRAPLERAHAADAARLLALLKAADAFRRGERFVQLVAVASVCEPGPATEAAVRRLERALAAAAGVDAGRIAREASSKAEIPARLDAARERAIRAALGADG